MSDSLALIFALLALIGAALLVDGTCRSKLTQTAKIPGGAAFVSAGWSLLFLGR